MQSYPKASTERYRAPLADLVELPEQAAPVTKDIRGITPETYALYGVRMYDDGILYPYKTDGKLIGYKVRHRNKSFPWEGENSAVTMFRPVTQLSGNRHLILTEGEQDAMAFHQMTGYTAWSVPFGATSAVKYIKRALREIESYENVYLAFDNDKHGQAATEQALELIDPTKVKCITFPDGIKDANDLLLNWESAPDAGGVKSADDYAMRLVWGAKAPTVDGVIDTYTAVQEASEWYFDRTQRIGLTTGYEQLDRLLGGWRPGEFLVAVGGTGSSKSTTARQLIMRQVENDVPCALITLEDTVPLAITRFMEIHLRKELIHGETPVLTKEEFQEAGLGLENLSLVDGFRMHGVNMSEGILKAIAFHARTGVKFVVVDHLTAVSDTLELRQFNEFIRELYHISGRFGITILGISHMSRDKKDAEDNEPSLARLKNSSAIGQWSTGVLGLTRERGSNKVRLNMLKQSRTWGVTGEAWFLLNSDTMQLEETDAPPPEVKEEDYNGDDW
jgi:KaiC/GvpD/RAD55 family RecA-like ATPase